ncbi:hypothetical protein A4S05_28830 [Nostoc sp. KVJ20]|uniref:vWA domain-containing protein n=1 Tax=Nostoc sp. KVJ20 TaxID=457944 RepID=UPI00083D3874|nr:vWA domain-containing protein [Nostoc sp. KVJ20]ODH01463.1 hypothetical protein A4S05_28830 [Nostoc sp. KVJ20]
MHGQNSDSSPEQRNHQLPSSMVAKEFGEVNVRNTGLELQILFTILMEPQGEAAEGWQTGVALDASASMKDFYGRKLEGKIPADVSEEYEKKGWLESRVEEGRRVKSFQKAAYEDAIQKGYLRPSPNIVQPLAQQFIAYLAENLDAHGGTTVIYWACGSGAEIEILGDFTEAQCRTLDVIGPKSLNFGNSTILTPAVKYFAERFVDAKRGMFIFITDGRVDDLSAVKQYTTQLAKDITSGQRHPVKCVLIGVGNQIDKSQLEELDDFHPGTNIDIWDYKIAKEMASLVQIFAEVVYENQIVAPTGTIYDAAGNIIKKYTDGLPAKVSISMSSQSEWFELEVYGQRIRQPIIPPKPEK